MLYVLFCVIRPESSEPDKVENENPPGPVTEQASTSDADHVIVD